MEAFPHRLASVGRRAAFSELTGWKRFPQTGKELAVIGRIWHGYTPRERADAYEELLKSEIFVGIEERHIPGYLGIQLLRRDVGDETEFVTIMWFDSLEAVRRFAGEDYEAAVVPPKAQALLTRYDARSQHYDVRAISEDMFGG